MASMTTGVSREISNTNEYKPISSIEEFYAKYSVDVDEGIISVTDRTTKLVQAKLTTKHDQCIDDGIPDHFYNRVFYFVLKSDQYVNAKYVYSFDLDKNSIKCILAPLRNPHFMEKYLVNFGSGFTTPGPQKYNYDGRGVITVYDLTRQEKKEVNKIFVSDGGSGGWDGDIDQENKLITAFDHVKGTSLEFPFLKKV